MEAMTPWLEVDGWPDGAFTKGRGGQGKSKKGHLGEEHAPLSIAEKF